MESQKSFKIYCKRNPNLSLAIKDGKVILAPSNPTDETQHWYKIERSNDKKIVFVNKATKQAIKHSVASPMPVDLVPYDPATSNDESVQWTYEPKLNDGYSAIKVEKNGLSWDAAGNEIHNGTDLVNYKWIGSSNQRWIVEPHAPAFRIYCKRKPNFPLTVKDGKVILSPSNPSDDSQLWYKIEDNNKKVRLVNKATRKTIKHTATPNPVELAAFDPTSSDESFKWSVGPELDDGYVAISVERTDRLNWDVHDGTSLINNLWNEKRSNQRWIFEPANGGSNQRWISEPDQSPAFRIYCKRDPALSLTIRYNKVILASSDPADKFQYWYKYETYNKKTENEGFPYFAVVNKATHQAISAAYFCFLIRHSAAYNEPVQLVPYNSAITDEAVLWTQGSERSDGYRAIKVGSNHSLVWDAAGNKVNDGTALINFPYHGGDNQLWIIAPY